MSGGAPGRRLAFVAALCLLAGALVAVAIGAGSGRRAHSSSGARPGDRPRIARRGAPVRPRAAHAPRHHGPSPGSLPQTEALPSASSALFGSLMARLWSSIVLDSPSRALPAFFPRGAYVQLKAIAGAESDWSGRLVGDYTLDIHAAHALLGSGAGRTRLLRVIVPSQYAHWVEPGVCFNQIGYYEVPNSRVVYSEGGEVRSFGIASMISWRGVWYVVHLGAVLREGDEGVVDEPSAGPGSPAYSGTC